MEFLQFKSEKTVIKIPFPSKPVNNKCFNNED